MCTLPASQYPRGSGHPFFLDTYMASGAEHQGLDKEPLKCLIVPRVLYWVPGEGVPMMRALENQRSGGQAGVGGPGPEFRGCVSGSAHWLWKKRCCSQPWTPGARLHSDPSQRKK